ncbi:hypothetical protein [Pseudosporangium ferrugineum]|uniref:Uncharacterized protein n=1 Tax=Pseudosporangium ferrugineum TaxID=439699 RepID=A0A2T0RKG9_9ACTN|nr:hypothetical protein [Pseudosporangium ferrugineum]PRY21679.1 hypothetical protein CLV70_119100 [Pseudosporangium ferrugineum]
MKAPLRRLHHDGHPYRWQARPVPSPGHRVLRLRIFGAGKTGRALQVDLPQQPGRYDHPSADDVRELIARGLAAGWDPHARGGTFPLPPP